MLKAKGVSALWNSRPVPVDTVVIHAMSDCMRHPEDPYNLSKLLEIFVEYKVSAHYYIDRKGHCYSLVPEDKRAWHAGVSRMPAPDNRSYANNYSIGIELAGINNTPFTPLQYETLRQLCAEIETRHDIKYYVGHSDISGKKIRDEGLRKDAKWDPGKDFAWEEIIMDQRTHLQVT